MDLPENPEIRRLKGLSLFSGIGGFEIALRDYVAPVAYCEIDPYCQSVLLSRMQEGNLPKAPIWPDVRTLSVEELPEIDIIFGGPPCQDISVAGHGIGLSGKRSGLFFEIIRLAKEIKPTFIFLENVAALTTRGGLIVVRQIAEMGYDLRWCVISASSIGALHKRERFFLLAHSTSKGTDRHTIGTQETHPMSGICCYDGNTNSIASQQADQTSKPLESIKWPWRGSTRQYWPFESRVDWQEAICGIRRTSDGVSNQLDRLRSLGNAVVPIQCRTAFEILMGLT